MLYFVVALVKLINENWFSLSCLLLITFVLFVLFTLMSIKLIVLSSFSLFFGVFATLGDMRVHFMVDSWNLRDFVKSFSFL